MKIERVKGKASGRRKAGHRSWAAKGGKVKGKHVGDTIAKETRSRVMARIKSRDTGPELALAEALACAGISGYEKHCRNLFGTPDFVFLDQKIAVFVDGDFWHGYRFPLWKHKLSPSWQKKITSTRCRDRRNFAALRRAGWKVIRIWEHQIERNVGACCDRVGAALIAKSGFMRSE